MKDLILIDSDLPVNFWAEAMNTANYLHNYLPTKRDGPTIIPEKAWPNVRQNLEHVRIFRSRVSKFILTQKHLKLDVWETWKGIFIGYIGTTKHLKVWVSRTYLVFIANEPIVNESERGVDLLIEYTLPPAEKYLRL